MQFIKGFAPWITFSVLTGLFDWRVGLTAGLVLLAAMWATSKPRRLGYMGISQGVIFGVLAVIAFVRPDAALADVVTPIATTAMGLAAGASILFGRPFTLDFSRGMVSPEIAKTATFMRVNRVIAEAWTGYFAATAVAGFAADLFGFPFFRLVQILLLVAAFKFTTEYPKKVTAQLRPAA